MLAATNRPKDDSHYLFTKPTANFQFSIFNFQFSIVHLPSLCSGSACSLLILCSGTEERAEPHQTHTRAVPDRCTAGTRGPLLLLLHYFRKSEVKNRLFSNYFQCLLKISALQKTVILQAFQRFKRFSKKWMVTTQNLIILYIYINIYIIYFV